MPSASAQRLSRELVLAAFGLRLGGLDTWVVDRLTSALEDVHLLPGQRLFAAGASPEHVYFVTSGEIQSVAEGRAPWKFRGKWLLGTFEALADKPYTRNTIAVTEGEALRLSVGPWLSLLEDSFDLARAAVQRSSLAVAHIEEQIPAWPAPPPRNEGCRAGAPAELDAMHRLAFLADVRMLRGPGVQALADLAEVSTERSYASGEVLLPRGVEREDLMVVVQGRVHASRLAPAVERTYGPGDLVCGVAAFGAQAPPWEAVAIEPTRVIAFSIRAWFDLMEEHFELVRSTLGALASRRELLLEHLAEVTGGVVLT